MSRRIWNTDSTNSLTIGVRHRRTKERLTGATVSARFIDPATGNPVVGMPDPAPFEELDDRPGFYAYDAEAGAALTDGREIDAVINAEGDGYQITGTLELVVQKLTL